MTNEQIHIAIAETGGGIMALLGNAQVWAWRGELEEGEGEIFVGADKVALLEAGERAAEAINRAGTNGEVGQILASQLLQMEQENWQPDIR